MRLIDADAFSEWLKEYGQEYIHGKKKISLMYIWKHVQDMPSAQPEPCDDPRADVYYLAEKIGIHRLYALVVELRGEPEPCEDAVSRQAAIDAIESTRWYHIDKNGELAFGANSKTDVPLFKAEDIFKVIKAIPSAQPEQRWIPCSERLPEDGKKEYWVCTDTGYQCECRWTNINHFWTDLTREWHWHIMDIPQYSSVIAWMPLPEPYGEEGEE